MSDAELALYLTYEFSAHFNPGNLREVCLFKEVKVWSCPETGLPVFSYGQYHGVSDQAHGLPALGGNEVHVRISKDKVVKMALVNEDNSDVISKYQEGILSDVYSQILSQMSVYAEAFRNEEILEMMKSKKRELSALSKLVRVREGMRVDYAH